MTGSAAALCLTNCDSAVSRRASGATAFAGWARSPAVMSDASLPSAVSSSAGGHHAAIPAVAIHHWKRGDVAPRKPADHFVQLRRDQEWFGHGLHRIADSNVLHEVGAARSKNVDPASTQLECVDGVFWTADCSSPAAATIATINGRMMV